MVLWMGWMVFFVSPEKKKKKNIPGTSGYLGYYLEISEKRLSKA
jgi:hypothetical protein